MSVAMMFPGQGSQSVGMLADLMGAEPVVGQTFEEASDALGYDLASLALRGPESDLNRTDRTQPAMLAAGVAVWRAWQAHGGPAPVAMAGHSLGEYSALVCAGALEFPAATRLVALRGRLMQQAVPEGAGAMAAVIGLEDDQVEAACRDASAAGVVEAVNFNAPGQVVIAGESDAVDRAVEAATAAGARRAIRLPVSVPSHCRLMSPVAEALAEALAEISVSPPAIPVFHNVDGQPRREPREIRQALADQVHRPVRWVACVNGLAGTGAGLLVEAGPGRVLTGLARRIDRRVPAVAVEDPESLAVALKKAEGESS
ncbi:MAG: ACP S-malonyltransferase [Gammaproteobacteria bacterium]